MDQEFFISVMDPGSGIRMVFDDIFANCFWTDKIE